MMRINHWARVGFLCGLALMMATPLTAQRGGKAPAASGQRGAVQGRGQQQSDRQAQAQAGAAERQAQAAARKAEAQARAAAKRAQAQAHAQARAAQKAARQAQKA